MVHKIQADYARLEAIGALFVKEATQTSQLLDQVRRLVEALQNGDWVGTGAQSFFKEMDALVVPGMKRLVTTLQDASGATKRILAELRQAEEEAGTLFRGDGSGSFSGESGFEGGGGMFSPRPGVPDYGPITNEAMAGAALSNDFFDNKRQRYTVSQPTPVKGHKFDSGTADALKYEVTINGHKVEVYAIANPDPTKGKFHTVEQVAKAIAVLPEPVLARVKGFNIEPSRSPDDVYWAKAFNDPNFTTYMNAGGDGVISVFPQNRLPGQGYMDGTLIHEAGHVLSEQLWGHHTKNGPGWQNWAAIQAKDGTQTSDYGANNTNEDFSESLLQWSIYKGTTFEDEARKLWGNRFKELDKMMK